MKKWQPPEPAYGAADREKDGEPVWNLEQLIKVRQEAILDCAIICEEQAINSAWEQERGQALYLANLIRKLYKKTK